MRRFLLTAFTGKDNESADLSKLLLAFAAVPLLGGLDIFDVTVLHHPFDIAAQCFAWGGLVLAHAGGQLLKSKTEPGGG